MKEDKPFKITVNDQFEFDINKAMANGLDFIQTSPGRFHVLHHEQSYQVELVGMDRKAKTITLHVNNNPYVLRIEDKYDQLINRLGLAAVASHKVNMIRSPMPGLVLQLLVKPGQDVKKGDALLILEAMKMENVIKAAADGTVKLVHVEKGSAVDKGQLMIEID